MKKVFILIPSLVPTGPIKGAVALANFLVKKTSVTLVAVKDGPGCSAYIDSTVKYHCLNNSRLGLVGKIIELRRILREAGGLTKVASVSYCFSADLVNIFCSKYALTCSSVRGNLTNIYKKPYTNTYCSLKVYTNAKATMQQYLALVGPCQLPLLESKQFYR